jgi:NADPH:quinone reductase-like Zn-dependent oxidoreductase
MKKSSASRAILWGLPLQFNVGDKVFASKDSSFPKAGVLGTYADYVALKEDTIALVPDGLSLDEMAGAPVVSLTAWQSLKAINPKPGQRILILSASSSVGVMAVQFAKHFGLHVVGTAGAKNLDLVRSLGADEVVASLIQWTWISLLIHS